MSYYYALVDNQGNVSGVSQLGAPVSQADMVPVDSFDFDFAGKLWDGTAWVTDTNPPAATPRLRLTKGEFRDQFTTAEKQAIYTAAESSVDIKIFLDDLMAVNHVDLDFPKTINSVNALESLGLIGTGRAAEILSGI